MADLTAGVTRYPAGLGSAVRMPRVLWVVGVLCFLGGLAATLLTGGVPIWIAAIVVVGVLSPVLTAPLPWWLRVLVLIGVTLAAGVGVDRLGRADIGLDWGRDRDLGYVACYAGSVLIGLVLLGKIGERRAWRRRLARAEGAPPSGQDPTGGRRVGRLLTWSDAAYDYEVVDPSLETCLQVVRALDGDSRSIVSIHIGRGELDIGGDARGAMIVQQSDNRRGWRGGYQVAEPTVVDRRTDPWTNGRKVRIRYAGADMVYPPEILTELSAAEAAVRSWLDRGERDRSLNWWRMPGWDGLQRPGSLQERDAPGATSSTGETDASHGL